jgi:NTP pyrophosphatase (non-canonical NTP hydrolase)
MPYKVNNLLKLNQEHQRQIDKFGLQTNTRRSDWMVILMEEVGEVAKAIQDGVGYEEELIQVAAVAMTALENWQETNPSETN